MFQNIKDISFQTNKTNKLDQIKYKSEIETEMSISTLLLI